MTDPIIAKIELSVEVEIKKSDVNMNKLEEKVNKASKSAGCKCLEESIEKINKYLLEECRDKTKEPIHSHRTGNLETLMGPIKYPYTKVQNKENGEYYSPLKKELGIEKYEQISDNAKLKGVLSASDLSYRDASDRLGGNISHATIRKYTIRVGNGLSEKEEELPAKAIKKNKSIEATQAFLESDGIVVPEQGKKNKKMEVKVAICYSGREDRYKESESGQKKLQDKVVYGDICKSEEFIEKASLFFNQIYNLLGIIYIVVLGDGAPWIKGFLNIYTWAAYQLDRFHLWRKLKSHFSRKKEIYDELVSLIKENKIEEVLLIINKKINEINEKIINYEEKILLLEKTEEKEIYQRKIKHHKRRLKKAKELLSYIETNKDGINGIDKYKDVFDPKDLIVGTGGIENQVKITIASRMKGRGRCWKRPGARAMVKLLCSLANGWHTPEDYLALISTNKEPEKIHENIKIFTRKVSKGKSETFRMEQVFKGSIPCNTYSSSPMGNFKKGLSSLEKSMIYN